MEVMQILHMNKGDGETCYAKNSTVQRKTLSISKPIIEEAVLELIMRSNIMGIADLGCSIIWTQHLTTHLAGHGSWMSYDQPSTITKLRVYLNDLLSNDFNTIFMSLPEFFNKLKQDYYDNHQHLMNPFIFVVPAGLNNKGNICISKSSPQVVLKKKRLTPSTFPSCAEGLIEFGVTKRRILNSSQTASKTFEIDWDNSVSDRHDQDRPNSAFAFDDDRSGQTNCRFGFVVTRATVSIHSFHKD